MKAPLYATLLASMSCFLLSGCDAGRSAFPAAQDASLARHPAGRDAVDTTSILKRLTKQVTIGSTIDAANGDRDPRALSIVPTSHILKQGDLLVCNFDDKSASPGTGTTIELLDPQPGSKPVRFVQSASIEGCDGDAISANAPYVYGAGLTAHTVVEFNEKGDKLKTYDRSPIDAPFADADAKPPIPYTPVYVFVGDAKTGSLINIGGGFYGGGDALEVAKGFAVNRKAPAAALGPSGLQYDKALDTLYIVDGVTDTVVAFEHASDLLEPDEIVVQPGGKTFKCEHPNATCGKLIYSGSPLKAPMASALLPNGNLVVANTAGGNTLVELTPAGQVLATKVVDQSPKPAVFGLVAAGTNDSNTTIYFTDTNTNTVEELAP